MKTRSGRRARGWLLLAGTAAGGACVVLPATRATAEPDRAPHAVAEPDRAAVDAQCPWGRLADGHGHFVRCLTGDDVARLHEPPVPAAAPVEPAQKPPPAAAVAPAEPAGKTSTDSGLIWPLPAPKPPVTEPAPPAPPPQDELVAELGQVVADSGALSDAQKALRKMRDRLAECASKNGGLTADRGEVELRFLVQERGRAEGVSIKKKRAVGDAAAKCIADVVDRRFVGFPDAPAVGATLVVTISKKKK